MAREIKGDFMQIYRMRQGLPLKNIMGGKNKKPYRKLSVVMLMILIAYLIFLPISYHHSTLFFVLSLILLSAVVFYLLGLIFIFIYRRYKNRGSNEGE